MNDSNKIQIRVRIPPSPTGFLHIGTARMALFNWLFARQNKGKIVFRPEDTDRERSKPEFEKDIVDGLKWLGIDWDEGPDVGGEYGPYRQSERTEIYKKYVEQLLSEDKAYYCFCTKEDLEQDRQAMLSQGLPQKYSGKCRTLDSKTSKQRISGGEKAVIRFKVPEIKIEFNDIIRGKISFDMSLIGDFVIAKDVNTALYAIAGVIDDYLMKITHVIRGEDIISSTPRQISIQRALGFNEVQYAHLPLVLAPDRSKLSKRYLETSLNDYKTKGYLPEAIVNFMAFLGWHPQDNEEILNREKLLEKFDLKKVQKGGAIFNVDKLDWINSHYLKNYSAGELADKINDFIPDEWKDKKNLIIKILGIEKERMKNLAEFKDLADFFFQLPDYNKDILTWKETTSEKTKENLNVILNKAKETSDFSKKNLELIIMPLAEARGRGELLWPLRVALSGKKTSPGPFEIMEVLGKEEAMRRISAAIDKI